MVDIRVEANKRDDFVVVVRGELDWASSAQLRAAITALLNRGGVCVIGLDLSGVDLLDSVGVGTIVVASRICRQVGVQMRVIAASPHVAQVLRLTGVEEALPVPMGADVTMGRQLDGSG